MTKSIDFISTPAHPSARIESRLKDAIRLAPARYVEVRFQASHLLRIGYRGQFLQNCSGTIEAGGCVRALSEGGWGVATFNDIDSLEGAVARACEVSAAVGGERVELAPVEPVIADHDSPVADQLRQIPLEHKRALLEGYNQVLLDHDPRIGDTRSYYGERVTEVYFVSSEGASTRRRTAVIDLILSAIARQANDVQVGSMSDAFRDCEFDSLRSLESWAHEAATDAIANLSATPVKGGVYTVVCDPRMTGLFTHEAFGHLSEADHQFMNPQLQDSMKPGRVFGRPILNVFDSGVDGKGALGTIAVDDEGVPTRRTDLIREGQLVGRLHSRETAARMGEQPTGNARAQSYQHSPLVRMRNTAIAPGDTSFDDMIADIDDGIYAVGGMGGQTRLGNFSFSSSHGFRIEKGKITERLRDIVLSGNIFKTLASIDAVGDDHEWCSAGRCGKLGQSMEVGLGGPHVRVRDVVVGGA